MRQDEEKRPILGKSRGSRLTSDGDERTSLNAVTDDFEDYPSDPNKTSGESGLDPHVVLPSAALLFTSVGVMVCLPIWLAGLVTHRSDPFTACLMLPTCGMIVTLAVALIMRRAARGTYREISLYPFFIKQAAGYGLLTSLGLVLQGFCGVPSRTPAYVQATSVIVMLPLGLITKYALYRKGYTGRQAICIMAVMFSIGLVMLNLVGTPDYVPGAAPMYHEAPLQVMQALPNITTPASNVTITTTTPNPLEEPETETARILWSLGFSIGCAFQAVAIMLLDEPIRLKKGHPMVVCMYGHVMTFLWMVFFFFFDLIPVFGWAVHLADFRHHLHHGVKCLVGADDECLALAWRGWLDIVFYTCFSISQCYLLAVAYCPLYVLMVTSSAVPLAAIIWLMMADTGIALLWHPAFTPLSVIVFIALFIGVPCSYVYRRLSEREEKEKFEEL